ncbi:hypothetical protein ACYSNR_12845 [Enterococcus sp. LJL128]
MIINGNGKKWSKNQRYLLILLIAIISLSGCNLANTSVNEEATTSEFLKTFEMKRLNTETSEELIPEKLEIPNDFEISKNDYIDVKSVGNKLYIITGQDLSNNLSYETMTLFSYDLETKDYQTIISKDEDVSISFEYVEDSKIYIRKYNSTDMQLGLVELNTETDKIVGKLPMGDWEDFVIIGKRIFTLESQNDEKIQEFDFLTMEKKTSYEKSNAQFEEIKQRMNSWENGYSFDYSHYHSIEGEGIFSWDMKTGEATLLTETNAKDVGQRLGDNILLQNHQYYSDEMSGEENALEIVTALDLANQKEYFLFDDSEVFLHSNHSLKIPNETATPANNHYFIAQDFQSNWARYHMKESVLIKEPIPNTENFKTTMAMNNGWFFLSDGKTILLIK